MCTVSGVLKGQVLNNIFLQNDVRNIYLIARTLGRKLLPGLEKFIL